jgi:hypothetical protein
MVSGMRLRARHAAAALALVPLSACMTSGEPSGGFVIPALRQSYIPLSQREFLVFGKWAAAFTIAPDVAVTNDHNLNLLPPERVLARSRDYDLLFFRIDSKQPVQLAKPAIGETVIAYGQGGSDELREATGKVAGLEEYVPPRCNDCGPQRALVFDAEAGKGFSGGPVVDARSGAVLGITFGYLDGRATDGGRRMYAYDVELVIAEMHRLLDGKAR